MPPDLTERSQAEILAMNREAILDKVDTSKPVIPDTLTPEKTLPDGMSDKAKTDEDFEINKTLEVVRGPRRPTIDLVLIMHDAFNRPVATVPTIPNFYMRRLQAMLLLEEVEEYLISSDVYDMNIQAEMQRLFASLQRLPENEGENIKLENVADAIGDISVINCGASLFFGFDLCAIDEEIFKSNMTKLDENGRPIYNAQGKFIKGPNFKPPDLTPIIFKYAKEIHRIPNSLGMVEAKDTSVKGTVD